MRVSLEDLVRRMQAEFGPFDCRICIDTAPLLERSYARQGGLGWIGKNTCLINQEQGSWFFLGEVLTSLELEPGTAPPDRCGTCTRCIDACPTGALIPGGLRTRLDATRCVSYLTIELKGEIPAELRPAVGSLVFGCDICQEVCPWNRRAPAAVDEEWAAISVRGDLSTWADMTPESFRAAFRHTPVWRTKYSGFLRNVAVAMGNSGDERYRPALERLTRSGDPVVAQHARWALENLTTG
jgi:epoxyqueuosine reductase